MAEQTFYVGQKIEFMNGNNQKWYFGRIRTVETDRVKVQFSITKWQDPKYDQWITKQNYEIRIRPRQAQHKSAHSNHRNPISNRYPTSDHRNRGRHSHRSQHGQGNMRNNPLFNVPNHDDDMHVEVGDYDRQYYQHGARYSSNAYRYSDRLNSKHIDNWTSDELIQWVCSRRGVSSRNQKKLVQAITASNLTGKDFNSAVETVHDVRAAFPEISSNGANHVYEAVLQLRQNQIENNVQVIASHESAQYVPVVNNSPPNNNNNNDNNNNVSYPNLFKSQNKKLTERNQVLTATNSSLNEQIAQLQAQMQSLRTERDNLKNENNTLKQEIQRLKGHNKSNSVNSLTQSTTAEVNEQKNKEKIEVILTQPAPEVQGTESDKTYENKTVKNWNHRDLLDWIATIGLQSQWQQIMIEVITSNNCSGNDWIGIKNFKEFANKFNIAQKMLANRVFREFKKMKERQIEKENNEMSRNVAAVVNIWDKKPINEWTCGILTKWIKNINLNENDKITAVDSIILQEVSGEDFNNSIEEVNDIMDSLEVTNECAMKIFSALEVVRANN